MIKYASRALLKPKYLCYSTSLLRNPVELYHEIGLLDSMNIEDVPAHFDLFVAQTTRTMDTVQEMVDNGELTYEKGVEFEGLLQQVAERVISHPIISNNQYLKRFGEGVTFEQAKHEFQQFSVFGTQFNVAAEQLVANAPTTESYDERIKIILNEHGIPYKDGFEGELTGHWTRGTNHFMWLLKSCQGLGLEFEDIGKIWIGNEGTQRFVSATMKYYANIEPNTAAGGAFAIENWAANNLWKPWISGMEKLNDTLPDDEKVILVYLTYHNTEEEHHSQATLDELLENFTEDWFDAELFLQGAENMLSDGVQEYYTSQLLTLPEKDDSWPEKAF